MARGKRAKELTKNTRYVAEQALDSLYDEYGLWREELGGKTFGRWAVTRVWDVEYKPTVGRLVVTLDLTEPDTIPGLTALTQDVRCAHISNGEQCTYVAGHDSPHSFTR